MVQYCTIPYFRTIVEVQYWGEKHARAGKPVAEPRRQPPRVTQIDLFEYRCHDAKNEIYRSESTSHATRIGLHYQDINHFPTHHGRR